MRSVLGNGVVGVKVGCDLMYSDLLFLRALVKI